MKYLVDLDDTLVNTTALNNDAYNYALNKYGYETITTNIRLTRKSLCSLEKLDKIINEKQHYFTTRWLPYRVILNHDLLNKIIRQNKCDCFIWTKADKFRAQSIWQYCKLNTYFNKIIFDKKASYFESISNLCNLLNDDMIIYENNIQFFKNSKSKIVDTIINDHFHINGYLIRL